MKKAKQTDAKDRANNRTLLPLIALGGGLAVSPAMALELGELTVQSRLGQPLRASIAYALAPNEILSSSCVSVSSQRSTGGLPGIGSSSVSITERAIVITGRSAIREPMLGARVTINCPYTPSLSREYMLFVDPAGVSENQSVAAAPASAESSAPAAVARPIEAPAPIGASSRYRVQPGETLSDIVSRIENRSMSLWPAINVVFAANPDAFINNDPNRLKAGSWLEIPSLDGTAPIVSAAATSPVTSEPEVQIAEEAAEAVEQIASAYDPAQFDEPATADEPVTADEPATIVDPVEPVATDSTSDLKPGDVVMDRTPAAPAETVIIPDTELQGPQTSSESPNVSTAVVSTGSRSESTSLLIWLIGGGLAIIGALLFFGRRSREQVVSTPIGPVAARKEERFAPEPAAIEVEEQYDIDDDSPTEENLALDADLEIGTGFEEREDVEVAHDFGFAQTTNLDIELPFEPEASEEDVSTDIIPPMRNVESILESEVLPEQDDDDEYDMSVIVDATKMPQHDEVTERDLKAVPVEQDFTISQEADYNVLEQDYEDELSATQALNQEIERAAATLADDLGDEESTAEFEASYDPNDTNAVTVNMTGDDKTSELPSANDDDTAELETSRGKVDTKS